MRRPVHSILFAAGAALAASQANAQLRIATWNISDYNGGRMADLRTAVYGQFNGRSFSPDILLIQEVDNASNITSTTLGSEGLLLILNGAPGSPGDWAAAPFIDNDPNPTNQCDVMLYRTSKVQYLGTTVVALAGGQGSQPRNTMRFDVRPVGYTTANSSIGMYNVHLSAGGDAERIIETRRIRSNIQGEDTNPSGYPNDGLPAGYEFLIAGDLNIQSSNQSGYQMMVLASPPGLTAGGNPISPAGRVYDPIARPGAWNNSETYARIHTQDPTGAGGMDDRLDQILISGGMLNQSGLEYIGSLNGPQNPVQWNLALFADPNHSYRCWGNDGTSYNVALTTTGNAWVGPTIAQALKNVAGSAGHLPVYLDARVPARLRVTPGGSTINFGTVRRGAAAPTVTLDIQNDGDIAKWTAGGISNLRYQFAASAGFTAPVGEQIAQPGEIRQHTLAMSTAAIGIKNGTLTITHDAGAITGGAASITLIGEVLPPCLADIVTAGEPGLDSGPDGFITGDDFDAFVSAFFNGHVTPGGVLLADVATAGTGAHAPDGFLTGDDFDAFIAVFFEGCP